VVGHWTGLAWIYADWLEEQGLRIQQALKTKSSGEKLLSREQEELRAHWSKINPDRHSRRHCKAITGDGSGRAGCSPPVREKSAYQGVGKRRRH
jgi:hypothetical protein